MVAAVGYCQPKKRQGGQITILYIVYTKWSGQGQNKEPEQRHQVSIYQRSRTNSPESYRGEDENIEVYRSQKYQAQTYPYSILEVSVVV